MLALLSVWLGLVALLMSLACLLYRPLFTDLWVTIDLYACVFAFTFSGLVIWSTRKVRDETAPARLQARIGAALALAATAIIYALVAFARPVPAP